MVNKRGQEMTLGTIIAIILGIAVLVFLIFGFSMGWNNFWSKITGQTSTSNVEDVIQACETDCTLKEESSYNNEEKKLVFFVGDNDKVTVRGTCKEFVDASYGVYDGQMVKGFGGVIKDTKETKVWYDSADETTRKVIEFSVVPGVVKNLGFVSCSNFA